MNTKKRIAALVMIFALCFLPAMTVSASEDTVESTSVEISVSKIDLAEGKSIALDPQVLPENVTDKTFTAISSDETVATVDKNGRVSAVGYGTCIITFISGDEKSCATCKVNVYCTSFSLEDAVMSVGKTMTLAPAFKNDYIGIKNEKITWSSTDESIVSVDANGEVTAKKHGKVTITGKLTSENNFNTESEPTASCEITVKKLVEKIEVEKSSYIVYGGTALFVAAKVFPEDADNTKLSYTCNSDELVGQLFGEIFLTNPDKAGNATITIETTDGSNLKETISVIVLPVIKEMKVEKEEYSVKESESINIPLEIETSGKLDTRYIKVETDNSIISYKFTEEKGKIGLTVSGLKEGIAKVNLLALSNPNASVSMTIKVEKKGATKEDTEEDEKEVSSSYITLHGTKYEINKKAGYATLVSVKTSVKGNYIIPSSLEIDGVKYPVITIADNAFKGAKKITSVRIPASVITIGNSAFQNCTKLKSIVIPKNVTTIGSKAFYNCKKVKTVTIKSKKIETVGKAAFKKIAKKATIIVPKQKFKTYKRLLKDKMDASVKIRK